MTSGGPGGPEAFVSRFSQKTHEGNGIAAARVVCAVLALAGLFACGGDGDALEPDAASPSDAPACRAGQEVSPGQSCSVATSLRFTVMSDGFGCLIRSSGGEENWQCHNKEISSGGFSASRIPDTSRWRIDALP